MPSTHPSDAALRQLFASLHLLRPHGWPDPDFVPKPPFHPAAFTMPAGWVWGESCLGDLLDALDPQSINPITHLNISDENHNHNNHVQTGLTDKRPRGHT